MLKEIWEKGKLEIIKKRNIGKMEKMKRNNGIMEIWNIG